MCNIQVMLRLHILKITSEYMSPKVSCKNKRRPSTLTITCRSYRHVHRPHPKNETNTATDISCCHVQEQRTDNQKIFHIKIPSYIVHDITSMRLISTPVKSSKTCRRLHQTRHSQRIRDYNAKWKLRSKRRRSMSLSQKKSATKSAVTNNEDVYQLDFASDFHAVDVAHSVEQVLHLHRHFLVFPALTRPTSTTKKICTAFII